MLYAIDSRILDRFLQKNIYRPSLEGLAEWKEWLRLHEGRAALCGMPSKNLRHSDISMAVTRYLRRKSLGLDQLGGQGVFY